VEEEEKEFLKVLESRAAAAEGKIEVVDIYKKKSTVEVKELLTLGQVIEETQKEFPGLVSYILKLITNDNIIKIYNNLIIILFNDTSPI